MTVKFSPITDVVVSGVTTTRRLRGLLDHLGPNDWVLFSDGSCLVNLHASEVRQAAARIRVTRDTVNFVLHGQTDPIVRVNVIEEFTRIGQVAVEDAPRQRVLIETADGGAVGVSLPAKFDAGAGGFALIDVGDIIAPGEAIKRNQADCTHDFVLVISGKAICALCGSECNHPQELLDPITEQCRRCKRTVR